MSLRRLKLIRLALVLSCLAALFGTYLPGFFSTVAGAKASLLTTLSSLTQSEGPTLEELQQQMEAIKQQLDATGPTDELTQQYQKLLDQINNYDNQGMSGQSNIELQKKVDVPKDDAESSSSATNLKKKNHPKDKDDSGGAIRTLSGPTSMCISGSLQAGDPTFNRVGTQTTGTGVPTPCTPLAVANAVRYDAYEFELTDCAAFPTNVTLRLCGPAGCAPPQVLDTVLYVYRTGGLSGAGGAAHPFNPGNPCNNLVAANDDLNATATGPGGSSGGVGSCPTSNLLSGLQRSMGSGRFVAVVAGSSNATAGNYNLYVEVLGADCTTTQVAGCPVIAVSPSTLPTSPVNVAYPTTTFTASGGVAPYTFSLAGTLPTGMSYSVDTLSGTPTQTGGFPISITATDANGCSGTQSYSLIITNTNLPCITDGLTSTDPTFNRPTTITTGSGVPTPCTLSAAGTNIFYKAYEFTVSGCSSATLTATLCGPAGCSPITNAAGVPDSIIYLYRVGGLAGVGGTPGAFNPLSPCTNLVAANDDLSGTAATLAGSSGGLGVCSARTSLSGIQRTIGSGSFVLVVATSANGQTGAYNLSINISGSGCNTCTITCPSNITTSNAPNQCGAVVNYPAPTTNAQCGTVTCSPSSGAFYPVGTTTVTCTTTSGPSCSFTITVTDTQAPVITCPANVTQPADAGQCSAVVNYSNATATDNCPGVTVVCTPASGSSFPVGTTPVNCTATDAGGNTASCSFTVTVNDTQAPTITCPANITVSNDPNQCGAVVNYPAPTTSDTCPGTVTVVCTPASGSAFSKGTTTVSCTATDAGGNTATCSFTVTVNDTQAPTITCSANVTQSTDADQCTAVVNYSNATATDNCPGVTVVCAPASGSAFSKGTTPVNCTATDTSGNTASCSFNVIVNDTQAPTITCPANVTKSTDPNLCTAVVNYSNATATDNCPGVGTPTCAPASGSVFSKGTTPVTCTVSDASGNTNSCSFTVTVNDTQAPSIGCPANIVTTTSPGQCSRVVTYSTSASDNCPGVTVNCTTPSGASFPKGTTTVTCTATDTSSNTSSCSFTVTVNDNESPTISCPANITTIAGVGVCSAVVNYAVVANDNCPGVTTSCTLPSGSAFPIGTTAVTCTATDTSGNQTSCGFTVTVTNPNPVVTITGPPSGSIYAAGTTVNFTGTFTDAGGGTHAAVWTFTSVNPTINQAGTVNEGTGAVTLNYAFTSAGVYFVKLTVNDSCGGSGFSTTVDGFDAMVVIYDSESFVTGGGWINSPAGAFAANTSLTGKSNFGFNAKYHNGATIPTGQTEFKFKEGDLNFHSTSYEWLVISGATAQYKGSGTVNGSGDYGFIVTVIDGQEPGGGGVDKFRIKIWNKNAGNAVVYDTQPGAPDTAAPSTSLGGGSIVIH